MKEKHLGLVVGITLAAVTMAIAFLLPKQNVLDFFVILLAGIFGAYFGFAFSNPTSKKDRIIEIVNIISGLVILLFGAIVTPAFLIAGYLWHGLWDAIHHQKVGLVKINVPEWYVYGCLLYDWIIGVFLIWWLAVN